LRVVSQAPPDCGGYYPTQQGIDRQRIAAVCTLCTVFAKNGPP
jgi:hypothetical protein